MTEPDFEQIARQVLRDQGVYEDYLGELHIGNALKAIWNARGAADIAAVNETMKYYLYGSDASIVQALDSTLTSLDR